MDSALVLGVIEGLTIGLLAVGIALIYKANRFINLATAQIGTYSAVLLAKLVMNWGVSWWIAFVPAIAMGVATAIPFCRGAKAERKARCAREPRKMSLNDCAMCFEPYRLTTTPLRGIALVRARTNSVVRGSSSQREIGSAGGSISRAGSESSPSNSVLKNSRLISHAKSPCRQRTHGSALDISPN